jgi:hypothetical protein
MRNITPFTISEIDNLVAEKLDWSILDLQRDSLKQKDGTYRLFVQLYDKNDTSVYSRELSLSQDTLNAFIDKKDAGIIDNFVSGSLNLKLA